jgi:ATP-dependent helicase/nuclease subunit A
VSAAERDAAARRAAQTDFRRPLVLEAGAGTGKTAALVARVLAWTLGPGWERHAARLAAEPGEAAPERIAAVVLRQVVAITFTEAAAAEMASRVGKALLAIAERKPLPVGVLEEALPPDAALRASRARALLGALDQLGVRTIHAFCRRLLAEHPLEAELHPRFEVDADERRQKQIAREVLEAALPAWLEGSRELRTLARAGVGPPELEEALLELLRAGVPPEALDADPLAPERVAALHASLDARLRAFLSAEGGRLAAGTRAKKEAEAAAWIGRLRERVARVEATRAGLEALLVWLEGDEIERARKFVGAWANGDFSKSGGGALGADAPAVQACAAALLPALDHLAQLEPVRLDAARRLLGPLLRDTDRALRRAGVATFPMLLRHARDLLARRPDVTRRLRARIDQLLVDEFQDTDAIQCDLVRLLVLDAPEAEQPGLFLVGDPKQSIYGWRDADLGAYDAFVARVRAAGGEVAPLVVNHRSAPPILAEVERVVAPVMRREPGLQPEFVPLLPSPGRAADTGFARGDAAPVEHWVSWRWDAGTGAPATTRAGEAAELEARAVAADLVRLHRDHGVPWREVALLFRGGTELETYLAELRAAGVPFAVEGDRSYFQRREVVEAAALVRCVMDPNDQLALAALLRSALVGAPDAALIPLWAKHLPAAMAELHGRDPEALAALAALVAEAAKDVPADVPGIERVAGWEHSLVSAARALALARASFEDDPADVFVERLRTLFAFEAGEAARYLGPYRVANLDRFFRDLLEALRAGEGDPRAVLRALRKDVAELREVAEGRPKEAIEDAVQVLTIHKAKGLDFAHVYVLQLHKGRGSGEKTRAEELAGGWEYALLGARTLGYAEVQARREALEEAERVRTLYVALTRARERLVMAALHGESAAAGRDDSHAALLAERRGGRPDLLAAMPELAARGASHLDDADGVRWVFPALRRDPAPQPGRGRQPVFAPEAVRAQAEALCAARAVAQAESERAFHAPVSAAAHEAAVARARDAREADEGLEEGLRARARSPLPRDAALAVGTALHRALERLDPAAADPAAERARLEAGLADELVLALPAEQRAAALARAGALLDRFLSGPLGARLRALAPHVVARELPVLLPPDPADAGGPTGFLAGAIDLVYVDPETREWVVADYKTDAIASADELEQRVRDHALQGAPYTRALCDALGLERPPRFELWFLDLERVVQAPAG